MSIAKEFKDFAMRGNVVDLAVGVVIGGAFGRCNVIGKRFDYATIEFANCEVWGELQGVGL